MSATLHYDDASQLGELKIRGTLKRAEFSDCESLIADKIALGHLPRFLVILENFGGWERGEDWNNMEFLFTHGQKITKIAIVGAGTKTDEVKAFTGAGVRPTPVQFFTNTQLDDARSWLLK